MRRAFHELDLVGIACFNGSPTVYFKEAANRDSVDVRTLQRRIWNQGIAPVFVMITREEVHIYSALAFPAKEGDPVDAEARLVETLRGCLLVKT